MQAVRMAHPAAAHPGDHVAEGGGGWTTRPAPARFAVDMPDKSSPETAPRRRDLRSGGRQSRMVPGRGTICTKRTEDAAGLGVTASYR